MTAMPQVGDRSTNDSKMTGLIAEVITYNIDKAGAGRDNVESYLAVKYGIHKAGNYVNSTGGTIWDSTANTAYHHDVFGIGRDDVSGLNQVQSNSMNTGSGTGAGQSGKGNIIISTQSALTNNVFLMIGNNANGFSLTTTNIPVGVPADFKRLSRLWKVQQTGTIGGVTLSFDATGINIGMPLSKLQLIIDHDGDSSFTTGTVERRAVSSISGNVATFTNVTFSPAVFTFGITATPLPITLTSFTVQKTDCNNAGLRWTVGNAINFERFDVERSTDGKIFTKVGEVPYSATQNTYTFKEENLTSGNFQYRLKEVDIDGEYKYSEAKSIAINCNNKKVTVTPTLATTEIFVQGLSTPSTVRIYDVDQKQVVDKQNVNNNEKINIGNLATGVYIVQVIQNGSIVNTTKIMKQ